MRLGDNELLRYKETEIDHHGKLQFFLEKHSTKEGTWGQLSVHEGVIDFVFLNGEGEECSRVRINEEYSKIMIPPAMWHKIIPISESFKATLGFYCTPQRYFNKKYGLGTAHHDLVLIYQTYLRHLQNASILDVGCGSGRNSLYLAKMGHCLTGIDHNQTAIDTLRDIAQKEVLPDVVAQLCDLNQSLSFRAEYYDLVLSTVTLQFLNPQRIPALITELQELTKIDGYHFLVFPIQSERYPLPHSFTYLPKSAEMYHRYQDNGWSILEYKESVGHLHKQDVLGKQISGLFGMLLAQKKG